jgi:ribosome biogenesis GTPase
MYLDDDDLEESFKDIFKIALKCKFNDCKHDKEPGCAITKAIQDGIISQERLDNFNKQYTEVKPVDIIKNQYEVYLKRNAKYGL